jgi:hypothetical protein
MVASTFKSPPPDTFKSPPPERGGVYLTDRTNRRNRQSRQADAILGAIEHQDEGGGEGSEILECVHNTSAAVGGFIESYCRGEIQFGIRRILADQPQYGFLIGAAHPSNRQRFEKWKCLAPHAQAGGWDEHREQPYMLSHNVEVMEGVKRWVSSFVWLDRFDDVSFLGGEGLYEFTPFVISGGEGLRAESDRKVRVIHQRLAVACGQRGRKNVETAADGVDVSADLDLERERQRTFFDSYNDVVRGVCWQLFDSYINVCVRPLTESRLEGWELGYGPIDRGLSV